MASLSPCSQTKKRYRSSPDFSAAADAFAVRLCSYNEGLARALEKLSGDAPRYNGEIADALGGNAVAPMYIYYPLDSLFSTHPSTKERIRRLRNMV